MMPLFSPRHDLRLERHGWISSVLFHAIMGTGALALLSNLQIPIEPEVFTWNVAMVEAPKPEPNPEVVREPKPTPPKPQVTKAQAPPPQPVARPVQQRIVQQPVQAVQQPIQKEVTQPTQKSTEVTTVNQTASIVTQAVRQTEVNETVAPTTTREPVVKQEQHAFVPTATPMPTEAPVTRTAEPVVQPAPVEVREPVVQHAAVEAAREAVSQPQQTAALQTVETHLERATPATEGLPAAQPKPAAVEQAVASVAPTKSLPATKADYGWLMRALLGRIDQLKNYPHMARLNHWEGKVVLRAVIRDDGQVLMVDVHESSGRSILDNDAIETLRKASPLKLDHPLGKPQVAILMPISYSLR